MFEAFQLAFRFDVEAQDARFERQAHFIRGLADAGKHHFFRLAARRQNPRQFAAGNDVEARAEAREKIQNGEAGVGLHRVADQVLALGEGRVETLVGCGQRGMGIDVTGRAEFFGNAGKRNGFDAQFGIMAGEEFHGFFSSERVAVWRGHWRRASAPAWADRAALCGRNPGAG